MTTGKLGEITNWKFEILRFWETWVFQILKFREIWEFEVLGKFDGSRFCGI